MSGKYTGKRKVASESSKAYKDGLEKVSSPNDYEAFLRLASCFPTYTVRNLLILLARCPQATMLKKLPTWNKLGRRVKSGESGIGIIYPFKRGNDDEDDEEVDDFRYMSLFDISQTEPSDSQTESESESVFQAPPPSNFRGGADFGVIMRLLKAMSPYTMHLDDFDNHGNGYCDHQNKTIVLKRGISAQQAVETAIMEIAMAYSFHRMGASVRWKRAEADSIARIVSKYLGFSAAGHSSSPVSELSDEMERKERLQFLKGVQQRAGYLIDSIEGERKAREIGFADPSLVLLDNRKTAKRLFARNIPVYLHYPGKGELLTYEKKQIESHDGPYAVERAVWSDIARVAA